jgi:hypothetical protein
MTDFPKGNLLNRVLVRRTGKRSAASPLFNFPLPVTARNLFPAIRREEATNIGPLALSTRQRPALQLHSANQECCGLR